MADLDLEPFRPYLLRLARLRLPAWLAGKLEPGDLVQQTLLEAIRDQMRIRGTTPAELAAWLRQALHRNLANTVRDLGRGKRDVNRERPMTDSGPVAEQSSPSSQARRNEEAERLAAVLADLPDAQREAVVLRHGHGWSLAEIAAHLGRSPAAVAGLLHRGLVVLRSRLPELE